jgi:hypothetical protein
MTLAGDALARAIRVNFVNFTGVVALDPPASRPWASITFSGERHRLDLRLSGTDAGKAADAFLDGLSEREFDLRGHVLADVALVGDVRDGDSVCLTLEALTVEAS